MCSCLVDMRSGPWAACLKRTSRQADARPSETRCCCSRKASMPKKNKPSATPSASGHPAKRRSIWPRPSSASLWPPRSVARADSSARRTRSPTLSRSCRAWAPRQSCSMDKALSRYPLRMSWTRSAHLAGESPCTRLPLSGVLISFSRMLSKMRAWTSSGMFSPSLMPRLLEMKSLTVMRLFSFGLCWSEFRRMTLNAKV
mmetsp:Transcript_19068/g.54098  ORF Transcript_19068/g.54098 Transcript_19068/m.54098 type:complete len:200 (-) Transcript_19068:528-1127(-)